jgi:hypothetical protein
MDLRPLPLAIAADILVATGVVHGIRSDRWGFGEDVRVVASRSEDATDDAGYKLIGALLPVLQQALSIGQVTASFGILIRSDGDEYGAANR